MLLVILGSCVEFHETECRKIKAINNRDILVL
jgi:hypothetical protein